MTQQIINVGAVANDGTGESLRSAFQAVNDNFSNVWAQGPVDSQVVISNNVISTNVTNQNLVLRPDGTGVITVASSVIPSIDSVWDLGTANAQYDSVYARYYYGDASNMTGLPQPTNLGAVNTDILPIATQAFNIGSQTQQWQKIYTNGIVAGNASVITIDIGNLHIPGGTNGYVLQTDGTGNLGWTAQSGGGGNGSPGGSNTQIQFNDAGTFGGQPSFTFNKTSNVMTVPGNIIPNGNAVQSLGNVSRQWKDLWVSNNTIYINSVPLTLSASNVLSIGGAPLVTVNANNVANIGNFVFNGNRLENTNGSSFDNGSLVNGATALLSLPANGNTGPVAVYNSYGNIVLQAGTNADITAQWNFNNNGTLSTQGNISANSVSLSGELIFANASGAVGEVGYDFSGPAINAYTGKSVTIRSNDQAYSWRFGTAGNLTLPDGSVLESGVLYGNVSAALGNSTGDIKVYAQNSGVGIQTYDGTNTKTWFYDRNGNLTLPGNTFAVNYANGTPVSLGNGGGISTGNITFSGDNIGSTNDIVNIVASNQVAITTSSLTSISAPCYIGLPDEFVADTEFNDDITAVQVGWTVVVDSVEYTVTYIDPAPPANQYRITADGATFVSGTEYTFTNPVPVPHSWTVDQYGTLTTPAGGTISQIDNDFMIEVGGTDIIALRTDGGDLIFDAAGNLNIQGPINSTTGVAALNLTGGVAYLTSSDNDTTALNMNATGVQLYAGVNVGVTAGVLIPGLETNYTDSRTALEEMFDLNSGEVGYPWGITLPVSQITYNELILLAPDTFPNQAACTAQAYDTQNNWELWQDTIAQSNVTITSNEFDWVFDGQGNLTLPGNTFAVNYANGTPVNISGGSGFALEYEVATFTANVAPGFGEIQFANFEGSNSAPSTAQKLFINQGALNEQSLGIILQQWADNSYRGTLSLNDGTEQLVMNISDGMIYRTPQEYRGFRAGLNQIWGDDCSINQLIITNSATVEYYNTDFLVEDDVFHATNLDGGNTHVMLNVYGSSEFEPINPQYLWNLFVSFVDNVLYDGETLRTNPGDIKTQFYNNTGSFRSNIPTEDYYQWFDFANGTEYFDSVPTTPGIQGTGATVRIRVNPTNTYTVLGLDNPGSGYIGGDNLFVLGTDLGGASPANDLTLLIDSVDGDGVITAVSYLSGDGAYSWPSNYISDGSDDQYDGGNYINTDLDTEISYANGETQTTSAAFGGGDYCVMYNESIFCMVTTNANIGELFYSGNLGSDGDGWVRWTGLVNFNDPVDPGNAPDYAYFNCEFLDGDLTVAGGNTYTVTLDSAGINLDGYYAYFNNNNNDYYFGSNNTFRLESQSQLYVQSYDTLYIQTMTPQRGPGISGPNIDITPADGSDAVAETNTPAQQGGSVNITGGDGGTTDGVNSLGASGGSVNITGGIGTGNAVAGSINLYGGEGANAGSINLYTDFGANSSGKVKINTYDGNTNKIWEFRPDGSTIYPTLTVDLHNGGTQSAQTLQFGDNTQQAVITGPTPPVGSGFNAQRLIIQGQRGDGAGEGGDVYLWGGDAENAGGDIKIYAGDADSGSNGYGGYVNIAGGDGFDSGGYVSMQGGSTSNGQGGPARLTGGYGSTTGGEANIIGGGGSVEGGNVNIAGGSSGGIGNGGAVNITGGTSGNGLPSYGNVNIGAGASTWRFDNAGVLTLPGEGVVRSNNDTVTIESYDTANAVGRGFYVGTNGALYFKQGADPNWLTVIPNASNAEISSRSDLSLVSGIGTSGAAGNNISITAGAADQSDYYTTAGGNVNITGGLGAFNDGGGGGPGGSVNISAGASSDPAGHAGNVNINTGGANTWTFDYTGNLTLPSNTFAVNYANGTQVSLGGGSYGDSNVATFLSSFGSNTVLTTGNVTVGNLIATANVLGNGYAHLTGSFDESQASTAGLYLGYAGGTPRIMFGTGNTQQTFEIDNDGGNLRFYQPGSTKATLTSAGDLSTAGNITATGKIGYANGGTATQSGTGQGVTINQLTGQITLAKSSWNAGDTEVFNISCNKIANADYVMAQTIGGSESSYFNTVAYPYTPLANSIRVQVTAIQASTSTPIVQFLIMKAATS